MEGRRRGICSRAERLFKLIVVDELQLDEIKTKKFKAVMDNLNAGKALVVLSKDNITDNRYKNVVLSARNLPEVKTAMTNTINVYDVMNADKLVVTKAAVEKIEEVYGNGRC